MKDQYNKNLNEPAKMARAVKPQTVRNTLGLGGGRYQSGVAPAGGYQSVWTFGENKGDFKNSPTNKPEPSRGE